MPSSLLLMSGTLPTEVFKILPVVHSGGGRGRGGTYVKMMDNNYLKEEKKNIKKDNKGQSEWMNSSIRSISGFPGGCATLQRIRLCMNQFNHRR